MTVDYYVMLIKKKRGFLNPNSFGDTSTFKELIKHAKTTLDLSTPTEKPNLLEDVEPVAGAPAIQA
jgi:hypothetical protein